MRLKFILPVLFAYVFLIPNIALASFGDCTNHEYLSRFENSESPGSPDILTATEITCVEEFNFEVSTPAGPRRIRAIRDINADWIVTPDTLASIERGARASGAAFSSLGDFAVDDITILILDDDERLLSAPPSTDGYILAATNGSNPADPVSDGECLVTVYASGLSLSSDLAVDLAQFLETSTAHEIFHCVQLATLSHAQMNTRGGSGNWWIEGSAEYFAAHAISESEDYLHNAAHFSTMVNNHTPLYEMAYEAAVFFWWYDDLAGISNLMGFLRRMADSGSAPAQQSAMRAVLPDEQWLAFAQAYADRSIKHPQGSELSFSFDEGETLLIESNTRQTIPLRPFAIEQGWLEFQCEEWDVSGTPTEANIGMRLKTAERWQDPPETVNTEGESSRKYRFAAFNTTAREISYHIDPERTVSCEPCAGSKKLDACLVGTWRMSGGGPIEWMKSQGIPITRANPGQRIISFKDDGVSGAEPFSASIAVEGNDIKGEGVGHLTAAIGRWSIVEGKLATCRSGGLLSGLIKTFTPRRSRTETITESAAGQVLQGYSCSETTLTTTLPHRGHPDLAPIVTHYSKISEPE